MKLITKIKQFRGIEFDAFSLRLNSFDGYGFSFFYIKWVIVPQKNYCHLHEEMEFNNLHFFQKIQIIQAIPIRPRNNICPAISAASSQLEKII